jgi:hypothetical protein
MIEDPEILTTEGSELTSTKVDEGTWLRPKSKQIVLSAQDEEVNLGGGQQTSDGQLQKDNSVDTSYDDIDTLKPEECFYRFSKGPNTPMNYGKLLPLFKKKHADGYYVYLGPDCRLFGLT